MNETSDGFMFGVLVQSEETCCCSEASCPVCNTLNGHVGWLLCAARSVSSSSLCSVCCADQSAQEPLRRCEDHVLQIFTVNIL